MQTTGYTILNESIEYIHITKMCARWKWNFKIECSWKLVTDLPPDLSIFQHLGKREREKENFIQESDW